MAEPNTAHIVRNRDPRVPLGDRKRARVEAPPPIEPKPTDQLGAKLYKDVLDLQVLSEVQDTIERNLKTLDGLRKYYREKLDETEAGIETARTALLVAVQKEKLPIEPNVLLGLTKCARDETRLICHVCHKEFAKLMIFVPCGHRAICEGCSQKLAEETPTYSSRLCIVCHRSYSGVITVHDS